MECRHRRQWGPIFDRWELFKKNLEFFKKFLGLQSTAQMPTTTATVTQQVSQPQQQLPPSSNQGTFFDKIFRIFLEFFGIFLEFFGIFLYRKKEYKWCRPYQLMIWAMVLARWRLKRQMVSRCSNRTCSIFRWNLVAKWRNFWPSVAFWRHWATKSRSNGPADSPRCLG